MSDRLVRGSPFLIGATVLAAGLLLAGVAGALELITEKEAGSAPPCPQSGRRNRRLRI
jgi:hypothetical protein